MAHFFLPHSSFISSSSFLLHLLIFQNSRILDPTTPPSVFFVSLGAPSGPRMLLGLHESTVHNLMAHFFLPHLLIPYSSFISSSSRILALQILECFWDSTTVSPSWFLHYLLALMNPPFNQDIEGEESVRDGNEYVLCVYIFTKFLPVPFLLFFLPNHIVLNCPNVSLFCQFPLDHIVDCWYSKQLLSTVSSSFPVFVPVFVLYLLALIIVLLLFHICICICILICIQSTHCSMYPLSSQ